MLIAVEFDGVLVVRRKFDEIDANFEFVSGAEEGLKSLKRAGHTLILYSTRANRALRADPALNPLWQDAGPRALASWQKAQPLHEARFQAMLTFVAKALPGVFDAIDEGTQGKVSADLYLDDRGQKMNNGAFAADWSVISHVYGEEES